MRNAWVAIAGSGLGVGLIRAVLVLLAQAHPVQAHREVEGAGEAAVVGAAELAVGT